MKSFKIQEFDIGIEKYKDQDYINLTDMAKARAGDTRAADVIKNWIRNRSTLEFLGTWEKLYNRNFKVVEFDHFKMNAGLHSFVLSPQKWAEKTGAIGIWSKKGKYGGTYAHRDIAFEFGTAISAVFKLYLIKEYQRFKEIEYSQGDLEWNVKRIISKANYHIHTDAVEKHIIPKKNYSKDKEWLAYAEEADILNVALFGCTAKDWESANPDHVNNKLNMRDFATINQLTILSNIESLNAVLIHNQIPTEERFFQLKEVARYQLGILKTKLPQKDVQSLGVKAGVNGLI